ncbi:CAP domain-containing protein [Egicoccus sp. AB-alg2]|uniref:CAP and S-layer homology domain-containing protein n=1 Tax=Egicoccus sp. AB-alg2 TaxID=3242693 RepID=UPI00359ECA98
MPRRSRLDRLTVVLLAALVGSLLAAPAAHAVDRPDLAGQFVDSVNAERVQRGLPRLHLADDLAAVARRHSVRMADAQHLHHNPKLTTDVKNWQRVSENVGRGRSVSSLHRLFMESDGHRRNILDANVTQVGVGVEVRDGTVWVTKVFRRPTNSASTASVGGFRDVKSGNPHRRNIDRLTRAGVTIGCSSDRYCPTTSVNRGQMATFIGRATGTLPTEGGPYTDVPTSGHPHAGNVNGTSAAKITFGCAKTRYCPEQALTRTEMAAFLGRALGLSPKPLRDFSDVDRNDPHAGYIQALADIGVTEGCAKGRYCPDDAVSRQQMASFLVRAFEL